MSLNTTPNANRTHIGIFGKRNAGKSSVINAVTSQNIAIVSKIKGTTTDPVSKAMELLPLGPVVIIDTPGIDDSGELGAMRVQKAYQVLNKTDIALLVVDGEAGLSDEDIKLIKRIKEKKIPFVIAYNKSDILNEDKLKNSKLKDNEVYVSAKTGENIHMLKEMIANLVKEDEDNPIVRDLLNPTDMTVLVIPIDSAAPKGRLILPQQQTIRDILDAHAMCVVTKETTLAQTLDSLSQPPKMVITDSQAFGAVSKIVPEDIYLTSFSILFARHKGSLYDLVKGVKELDSLQNSDKVLIAEGCTHHRQCDDIGTVKIPKWIRNFTKKDLEFEFCSGTQFPDDLKDYKMIVHCGGCMLNEREMKYRISCANDAKVPIVNYGILIAYINGILKRSVSMFEDIHNLLS